MKHILENNRICAIMRGVPLGKTLDYADAVYRGGVRMFEVAMNSGDAARQIELMRKHFGDNAYVGAGTVTVSYTHLDVYKRQDLIQLTVLVIGFIAITAIAIPMAGGWGTISGTITEAGKAGNLSFYGVESMGGMALFSLMFSIAIPCLGTPTYRMRIYTAKDDKTAIRALSLSGWLLLIFSLLPAIIGMAAFTIATNTGAQAVLDQPDFAFTYIATVVLGPVLGLMFMISGLSATMSSGDSDAIAGVTILIQDIRCV